jgi:hypothetical protein
MSIKAFAKRATPRAFAGNFQTNAANDKLTWEIIIRLRNFANVFIR